MMASRGCSILGSGTSPQRMSPLPCQARAFMCCFPMLRLMAVIRHVNVRLLHPFGLLENFLRHAMYSAHSHDSFAKNAPQRAGRWLVMQKVRPLRPADYRRFRDFKALTLVYAPAASTVNILSGSFFNARILPVDAGLGRCSQNNSRRRKLGSRRDKAVVARAACTRRLSMLRRKSHEATEMKVIMSETTPTEVPCSCRNRPSALGSAHGESSVTDCADAQVAPNPGSDSGKGDYRNRCNHRGANLIVVVIISGHACTAVG
jgi:hypothetical protein